uniref:GCR142 n=1 Tax=Schmidtea mediterranea TaxID=79327 RepID=A0A193KUN3_SCHMD|nr:GCR142 [Schmidtea mediterranea]
MSSRSNLSAYCQIIYVNMPDIPTIYFYIIFYLMSVGGILLNLFLLVSYKYRLEAILGKRATFTLSMIFLTVADFINSFVLLIDLLFLIFEDSLTYKILEMLKPFRNGMIVIECFLFDLLAFDRLLAVIKPLENKWRPGVIKLVTAIVVTLCLIFEVSLRYCFSDFTIVCDIRRIVGRILNVYYILIFSLFIIVNYACYATLFLYFIIRLKGAQTSSMRNILKMAKILFISAFLFNISLLPTIITAFIGSFFSYTVVYLIYIHIITNPLILILNNQGLRRIFLHKFISVVNSTI